MMKRMFLAVIGLVALAMAAVPAATQFLPVDEIRPGMVGVGRTVFEGSKVEEFQVRILGVIRNVVGPKRDLILAKLEGGPLAATGVIAGMSGSPVYIDGRLVGAVSYSLGQFSREAIAGITPIQEMIDATAAETKRAPIGQRARLEVPITGESIANALRVAFSWARPFAERPADVQVLGGAEFGLLGSQVGTMLAPIVTPIAIGGFSAEVSGQLGAMFSGTGLLPMMGQATGSSVADQQAGLEPGDAVGIALINGDLSLGATGTVTYVDGARVYAFGHPFYNLGPTQFPMTRAHIHTLLPSLASSAKLASTGQTVGTLEQDRATAISGVLGPGPALIPVKIGLETDRGLGRKDFSFGIVNDQLFTPLLTYLSVMNTLSSY